MTIKQISVFLENVSGRLAEVTKILAEGGINLRALTIADTADFGILRIVCENADAALKLLEDSGFTARETDVLAVEIPDKPGGLAEVMKVFHENGVNIEYLYASLEHSKDNAVVVFKVEDLDHGMRIIEENGLTTVSGI
jgi:hypothetical protein